MGQRDERRGCKFLHNPISSATLQACTKNVILYIIMNKHGDHFCLLRQSWNSRRNHPQLDIWILHAAYNATHNFASRRQLARDALICYSLTVNYKQRDNPTLFRSQFRFTIAGFMTHLSSRRRLTTCASGPGASSKFRPPFLRPGELSLEAITREKKGAINIRESFTFR